MLVNCTLCNNVDCHKMTQMYRKCACKDKSCDLSYRINNCKLETENWSLSQTGCHRETMELGETGEALGLGNISVRVIGKKPKQRYGKDFF